MALDRQSIEKKDFPLGRRGYDPEAVDTHLATIADEVAELRRSMRRRSDTLASSASEQVRAIVEAAESSANEIQHQAEEDAREIRDEANREAQSTREEAAQQAREYVGSVSESTSAMLGRLDAMENELGALIESLRTGANRINADLRVLEGGLSEVHDVVRPRPTFEPDEDESPEAPAQAAPEPAAAEEPVLEPGTAAAEEPGAAPVAESPEPEEVASVEEPSADVSIADNTAETVELPDGGGSDDAEGARLIALNMALNGTPREETERYLSENFQLADRDSLLDEVYASVEG